MGQRIGLFTDIHGDWDTLRRILAALEALGVDRLVCLGDLVVHGPEPAAVVDWFLAHPEVVCLLGNHDIGASIEEERLPELTFFSRDSYANTLLARQALGQEQVAYLGALPLEHREGPFTFTHAAPGNPFALLRRPEAIAQAFAQLPSPVMIAGHTHRTHVHHWPRGKAQWCSEAPLAEGRTRLDFVEGDRYVVNLGCTAQLRYDPHPPVCAVLEPEAACLTFHELPDLRPPANREKPDWLAGAPSLPPRA